MADDDASIYLASRSPRRHELLNQLGIAFVELLSQELHGADVDETPQAGESPRDYVQRVARAKAQLGWRQVAVRSLPARPVLAADTTVVLDGEILGKPDNAEHAHNMLYRLRGRTHCVLTAVAAARDVRLETAVSVSTVEFRHLDDAEIRAYVASGEPLDKAGAYAIQGRAAAFVRTLRGSYSSIMGLPLGDTAHLLGRFGIASNWGPRD
ncbi:MAG TPA: Maf family protein [Burkholderiales bacterium]|jgi:septum formation protein|nr:Maf family protein [Burkholderiales bacterium]